MKLVVKAPAKINWTLEVLGQRPDAYHEVCTILQTINSCDMLVIEPATELVVEYRGEPPAPQSEDLAWQAAQVLQRAACCRLGARLHLHKAIPTGSGLGGGSSDAAAALRGLNHLWGLGLSSEELARLGADLGSDVPFFLYGGTALAQGRGGEVTPLPDCPERWLVLLVPPLALSVKTATMYSLLQPGDYSDGSATARLAAEIRQGGDLPDQLLYNVFRRAALETFPGLRRYWDVLAQTSGRQVQLAGSGPAIFALADNEAEAREISYRVGALVDASIYTVSTLTAQEATAIAPVEATQL